MEYEFKALYYTLNEKLYNTDLVQIDSYGVYKIDEKYYAQLSLCNFSDKAISKVNVMINCFGKNGKVLIENMVVKYDIESKELILLNAEGITSMTCSILSIVSDEEVIEYKDFSIFYLERKVKFKDQYTDSEIQCIQYLNTTNEKITRDSFIPKKANGYGMGLDGKLVLVDTKEELFEYMDWVSKSIENVCNIAYYQQACTYMNLKNINGYNKAKEFFSKCIGYEDAYDLREKCDRYIDKLVYKEMHTKQIPTVTEAIEILNNENGIHIEEEQKVVPWYKKINLKDIHIQENYKKYIKYILIGLASVWIILLFCMYQSKQPCLVLKEEVVELGEETVLNADDFIDTKASKNIKGMKFKLKSDLTGKDYDYDKESHVVKTKDKKYLESGEYPVTIVSKDGKITKETKLIVQDTTAPTIDVRSIQVKVADTKVEYNKYFTVKDYSKCTFDIDDSEVTLGKVGNYKAHITATDAYGNSTTQDIVVHIEKDERVFYQGIYYVYSDSRIYSDYDGNGYIGTIPTDSLVSLTYIVQAADGSFWGVLSDGYVMVANDEYDFLSWYDYARVLRVSYPDDANFALACGVDEKELDDEENEPAGGLTYTTDCSGNRIFY